MATIDIFIKSYKNDFNLLQIALKTIQRNVTGYNNIILLIPEKDKHDFDTRNMPERTLIHYVEDKGVGWLKQQWYKMSAYEYSYADYILFSDSDCFFDHKINLQDYIADGKPEILYTSWDKVGDAKVWREPTEKFIKEPIEYEGMRRNCLIYHRSTLVAIGEFEPDLEYIIMTSHKFSEFNAMFAYAFKKEKEKYNFINTDEWQYVPPKAIQVWSHGNKEKGASEMHLREYIRTLESILICFEIPLP